MKKIDYLWTLGRCVCLIFYLLGTVHAQENNAHFVKDTFWCMLAPPEKPSLQQSSRGLYWSGYSAINYSQNPFEEVPAWLFKALLFRSRSPLNLGHTDWGAYLLRTQFSPEPPEFFFWQDEELPKTIIHPQLIQAYPEFFSYEVVGGDWPFRIEQLVHKAQLSSSWTKLLDKAFYGNCPSINFFRTDSVDCQVDYLMLILGGRVRYLGEITYVYPNFNFELYNEEEIEILVKNKNFHNYIKSVSKFELYTLGFFERKKLPMYYFETLDHMEVIFSEGVKKP